MRMHSYAHLQAALDYASSAWTRVRDKCTNNLYCGTAPSAGNLHFFNMLRIPCAVVDNCPVVMSCTVSDQLDMPLPLPYQQLTKLHLWAAHLPWSGILAMIAGLPRLEVRI